MNEMMETRTLDVVGAEIRSLTTDLQYHAMATVNTAIEIGRRLIEARDLCKHGEWMNFLKEQTSFSYSKANDLIKVFENYGSAQKSLFGAEINSQTYANLTFSKALALVAIEDEEERKEFVKAHDVEGMSTRELREAIRERDEARAGLANAESALDKATEDAESLRERVRELESREPERDEEAIRAAAEQAKAEAEAAMREAMEAGKAAREKAEAALAEAEEKRKKLDAVLEKQHRKVEKAEKEAQEAKAAAEKAKAEAEQAKAEAAAEIAKAAREQEQKAGSEAAELRAQVKELRRRVAMSGQEMQQFQTAFRVWQTEHGSVEWAERQLRAAKEGQKQARDEVETALQALPEKMREKMARAVEAQEKAWG